MSSTKNVLWELIELPNTHTNQTIEVIAARDIPYVKDGNRLQTFNIYVRKGPPTVNLVGTAVTSLVNVNQDTSGPLWQVHIHGGAWRDDQLTAASIEKNVAHLFSNEDSSITAVVSINYTVSPFPQVPSWLPTTPYDPIRDGHADRAREAVHPEHIHDVLNAFAILKSWGLKDGSYLLTGHSAGACLAFQTMLQEPSRYGLNDALQPVRPLAILGFNGLYDLPDLVDALGTSHQQLKDEYSSIFINAFGPDRQTWQLASPARFDPAVISKQQRQTGLPRIVVLDQSTNDQLVPVNQTEKLEAHLQQVEGWNVVRGHRGKGNHSEPWEGGSIISTTVSDVLEMLKQP